MNIAVERFELSEQTLQTQLCQLHEKVRTYVGQLWKLPFAYLTVTGAFYLQGSTEELKVLLTISAMLVILGILSFVTTIYIHQRINATVADIAEIEAALSLKQTVILWTRSMTAPYYAMLAIGIVGNAVLPFLL